jgi:DNA-binding transcriptional MerR regulator
MAGQTSMVSAERIERSILLIRGHRVMLDWDLAALYGVGTKVLNQAVRRNINRFPEDFMFQLTAEEFENLRLHFGTSKLRSQIVTSKPQKRRGGRRYLPYAFTEQGVAMLSSILRSKRAVQVNIEIMRTFVRLRRILSSNKELARKLEELERKIGAHDQQIQTIFQAIRQLMAPPEQKKRKMGFLVEEKPARYGRR